MKKLPIALLASISLVHICLASDHYHNRSNSDIADAQKLTSRLGYADYSVSSDANDADQESDADYAVSLDADEADQESDYEELVLEYNEHFPALVKDTPAVNANPNNLDWVQRVTTILRTKALAEAERKAQVEVSQATEEDSIPCPIFGYLAAIAHSEKNLFNNEPIMQSVELAEDHFDDEIERYVEKESTEEYAQQITTEAIHYAHAIIKAGGLRKRIVRDLIQDHTNVLITQAREHNEKMRIEDEADVDFISPKERTVLKKRLLKKSHGKRKFTQSNNIKLANAKEEAEVNAQDEVNTKHTSLAEMAAPVKEKALPFKNAHSKHRRKGQINSLARHIKREDFRRNKPKVLARNMEVAQLL